MASMAVGDTVTVETDKFDNSEQALNNRHDLLGKLTVEWIFLQGQENFASDPCELAFICVLLAITCVPINAFMISSMRVITYECELNLLTRLPQNFLDPYEA